jgi:hypothetical protein
VEERKTSKLEYFFTLKHGASCTPFINPNWYKKMIKNFNKQIELLLGLGIQDIEKTGNVSIRELSIKVDGSEELFPPSETNGVSLNLHSDSARMHFKKIMQRRVEQGELAGFLLLHNNIITKLGDLLEKPDGQSLYVSCMTVDGKILVKQDYTTDEAGKLVIGEKAVIDHDPEEEHLIHGFLAEMALSLPDELLESHKDKMAEGLPQEWVDYVNRERENKDPSEWFSPVPEFEIPELPAEEGGHDEVLDTEEPV